VATTKAKRKRKGQGSPILVRWFDAFSMDEPGSTLLGMEVVMDEIGFYWGESEKYVYIVREISDNNGPRFGMGIPKVNIIRRKWL